MALQRRDAKGAVVWEQEIEHTGETSSGFAEYDHVTGTIDVVGLDGESSVVVDGDGPETVQTSERIDLDGEKVLVDELFGIDWTQIPASLGDDLTQDPDATAERVVYAPTFDEPTSITLRDTTSDQTWTITETEPFGFAQCGTLVYTVSPTALRVYDASGDTAELTPTEEVTLDAPAADDLQLIVNPASISIEGDDFNTWVLVS